MYFISKIHILLLLYLCKSLAACGYLMSFLTESPPPPQMPASWNTLPTVPAFASSNPPSHLFEFIFPIFSSHLLHLRDPAPTTFDPSSGCFASLLLLHQIPPPGYSNTSSWDASPGSKRPSSKLPPLGVTLSAHLHLKSLCKMGK
jgi:hypothetical protein